MKKQLSLLLAQACSFAACGRDNTSSAYSTRSYTYGDNSWSDLLTKFNSEAITYEGIGNSLTYHNGSAWTFTWQKGQKLLPDFCSDRVADRWL